MNAAARSVEVLRRRAEELAGPLPPLLVAAERVASTIAQGVHGRRRVGQGETFWQYRRFAYGDSTQQIDWRRSARSDQLFVRQTEWEAAQSVWLWPDLSPSMRYRSRDSLPEKAERAAVLALALASLLVRGGERIALLGTMDRPVSGRAGLNRMALELTRELGDDAGRDGVPPSPPLPRFGAAVLIGDFLGAEDETESALRNLAGRGIGGVMLQVLDPAEAALPFRGRTRFRGLEAEGELLIGRAESVQSDYLGRLARLQDDLRVFATRAGWHFAIHHTDRPAEPALLALYTALAGAADM